MRKLNYVFICFLFSSHLYAQNNNANDVTDYTIPAKEVNCFQYFNINATDRNKVNTYLLSKLSQLMYTERLDFELRKLKNPTGFPTGSFSSSSLNTSSNRSFQRDFTNRFSHWFYDIDKKPVRPIKVNMPNLQLAEGAVKDNKLSNLSTNVQLQTNNKLGSTQPVAKPAVNTTPQVSAEEKYIADSIAFEKSKPRFKFLNKREDFVNIQLGLNEVRIPGFDPEVMVVSTEEYIIIAWRGTDDVYKGDAWEWIGTDFYFTPVPGDGTLAGTKLHAGMWASFKVIRNKLMSTLDGFEAKTKRKKIFITGHSLGGGMSLISAPYLAGQGYNIGGVYTFAAPRVVGNQEFVNKCNSLIGKKKIQRFEYGVDAVTKIWSPALWISEFKIPGVRNWWSAVAGDSNDEFYDTDERYHPMTLNPLEYNDYSRQKIDRLNGDIGFMPSVLAYLLGAVDGNNDRPKDGRGFSLVDFGHHNPTYYTLKAYDVLSSTDKARMPQPANTFPYVLPGVKGNK